MWPRKYISLSYKKFWVWTLDKDVRSIRQQSHILIFGLSKIFWWSIRYIHIDACILSPNALMLHALVNSEHVHVVMKNVTETSTQNSELYHMPKEQNIYICLSYFLWIFHLCNGPGVGTSATLTNTCIRECISVLEAKVMTPSTTQCKPHA